MCHPQSLQFWPCVKRPHSPDKCVSTWLPWLTTACKLWRIVLYHIMPTTFIMMDINKVNRKLAHILAKKWGVDHYHHWKDWSDASAIHTHAISQILTNESAEHLHLALGQHMGKPHLLVIYHISHNTYHPALLRLPPSLEGLSQRV